MVRNNSKIREDLNLRENDDLIIFGIGNYAEKLCQYYGEKEIKTTIKFFVVTNKIVDIFWGVPVRELQEIIKEKSEYILILAVAKNTRHEVEDIIAGKFKRVVALEEFMNMSVFLQEKNQIRKKEVDDYLSYFKKNRPLFKYIEIETINRCNGECGFCPVNRNEIQRPYAKMEMKTFCKVINELSELNYDGNVALFSNNEPFLDARISDMCKYARQHLPDAYIYIASNGTLLSINKIKEIYPYLDNIILDIYKTNMDDSDPQNIATLLENAKKLNMTDKITVHRINANAIRSSRGGESPNSKVEFSILDRCPLPLVQIVIRPDGKVSLCCNDALGKITLGDVTQNTLFEIWNSELYERYRDRIMNSRENVQLCKYCDYVDMRKLTLN